MPVLYVCHGKQKDVSGMKYPYIWSWHKRLGERRGQRCRILAIGKMNNVALEFEDGFRVITCRMGLRKVKDDR